MLKNHLEAGSFYFLHISANGWYRMCQNRLFSMYCIGRCGSGGLPPENSFEVTPTKPSENALLQNGMYLLSSLVLARETGHSIWLYRILNIDNEKEGCMLKLEAKQPHASTPRKRQSTSGIQLTWYAFGRLKFPIAQKTIYLHIIFAKGRRIQELTRCVLFSSKIPRWHF